MMPALLTLMTLVQGQYTTVYDIPFNAAPLDPILRLDYSYTSHLSVAPGYINSDYMRFISDPASKSPSTPSLSQPPSLMSPTVNNISGSSNTIAINDAVLELRLYNTDMPFQLGSASK